MFVVLPYLIISLLKTVVKSKLNEILTYFINLNLVHAFLRRFKIMLLFDSGEK